jgi:hypothetical protein
VKKWLIFAALAVVLIATAIAVLRSPDSLRSGDRRAWKQETLGEIAARVVKPGWPTNELALLKNKTTGESTADAGWLSDRIIVTRKGEWLAYANVCVKEPKHIHDLFLARGSDGRWYYSTYHFCIGMVTLRMEEQPEDLAGFAETYFLRTFDGQSDDCLQKTWPPDRR